MLYARLVLLILSFSFLCDSSVFAQGGKNAVSLGIWFGYYEPGGERRGLYQCDIDPANNNKPLWTKLNNWTPWFRVNTDDDWGGCALHIGIHDPYNAYPGLDMSVDFQYWQGGVQNPSPSDLTQCPNPGVRNIPRTANGSTLSEMIFLDMDHTRLGGCQLTFRLQGSASLKFQMEMYPDDVGVEQCPSNPVLNTPKLFQTSAGNPFTLILDTDYRYGGCKMRFRLTE